MYMLKIYWSFSIQINCHKKLYLINLTFFIKQIWPFFTFVYRNWFCLTYNSLWFQNQFFITRVGDKSVIKNKIGDALFNRILRAHRYAHLLWTHQFSFPNNFHFTECDHLFWITTLWFSESISPLSDTYGIT